MNTFDILEIRKKEKALKRHTIDVRAKENVPPAKGSAEVLE